jgi:hypothetical protein
MGRPQNLSSAQERLLRAHAEPHYSVHLLEPENDTLEISFTMAPNEVVYIECSPAASASNHASCTRRRVREMGSTDGRKVSLRHHIDEPKNLDLSHRASRQS